jgi:hypothetical protein
MELEAPTTPAMDCAANEPKIGLLAKLKEHPGVGTGATTCADAPVGAAATTAEAANRHVRKIRSAIEELFMSIPQPHEKEQKYRSNLKPLVWSRQVVSVVRERIAPQFRLLCLCGNIILRTPLPTRASSERKRPLTTGFQIVVCICAFV